MQFTDAVSVAGTRRLEDGYLVAEARSVRTGIQIYSGAEVGKPEMATVRVYRSPNQVFAADSLQSFSHAPITNDHPAEGVTAENWKALAVGEVSTAAKKDGEWVMLPLILKDAAAIQAVVDGKRELSAGYTCELDFTPGATADGEPFDAQQLNIKINHLALVDRARAGSMARIGDGAIWGASPLTSDQGGLDMPDIKTKTVLVDGLSVETTDAGAQAIEKLTKDRADMVTKLSEAQTAHATALAAKDKELATKDAEIDGLKAKVLDAAALDAAVVERGDLIEKAKAISPKVVTDGKTAIEIKKAVLGDRGIDLAGKSDDYINARFDGLVDDAVGADTTRAAITTLKSVNTNDAAQAEKSAHMAMIDRMNRKKSA
jgi:uncharacterized protein